MKMHSDYSHLAMATDTGYIGPIFQNHLERFGFQPGSRLQVGIPRVFTGDRDSFLIQYRLSVPEGNAEEPCYVIAYGKLFANQEVFESAIKSYDGDCMVLVEPQMVIPFFPKDRELPALSALSNPDLSLPIIADWHRVLGREAGVIKSEVLAYRLERRCVLHYELTTSDGGRASAVLKVVRPRKLPAILKKARMLRTNGFTLSSEDHISIPVTLGEDRSAGCFLMEKTPGQSLHDLIGSDEFIAGCRASGRALRKLHTISDQALAGYSRDDEVGALQERSDRTIGIFPELAVRLKEGMELIRQSSNGAESQEPACVVHRDFYDKQIMYSTDRTTLLDYDNLASGDRAIDFGNFIAHTRLRRLQHPDHDASIAEGQEAFELAYNEADLSFHARANWWQSASLIRLAALYALRPRWSHLAPELLELAIKRLASANLFVTENK